jgi:hypothetical protein
MRGSSMPIGITKKQTSSAVSFFYIFLQAREILFNNEIIFTAVIW